MTSNRGKKRSLTETNNEDDSPPSKKIKLDPNNDDSKDENKNDTDQIIIDFKNKNNITIDNLKHLFAINTTKFTTQYDVYQHFRNLSLALIRDLVLILTPNTSNKNKNKNKNKFKVYQFVEFEFYCLDSNNHKDVFAHCDDVQLKTCHSWYFHRSGNTSAEGYKYMNQDINNNKKWVNPRPNVNYRNGTFKGLDITFGERNKLFGGILIRSIRELKPLMMTNDTLSPSNHIEGPCNCVNQMLKDTQFENIKELTKSLRFNLDIFDNNNFMYVELSKNYNIKEISPQKSDNNNNIFAYEKWFYNSPRVGLTLKNEKSLSGSKLESFQNIKKDYVMAPYRTIRKSCLGKMKKYKPCIAMAMCFNKYYYNKLNNKKELNDNNSDVFYANALKFGPFKQTPLDKLLTQCKNGKNDSLATIKSAINKFPSNSSDLAELFGALNL